MHLVRLNRCFSFFVLVIRGANVAPSGALEIANTCPVNTQHTWVTTERGFSLSALFFLQSLFFDKKKSDHRTRHPRCMMCSGYVTLAGGKTLANLRGGRTGGQLPLPNPKNSTIFDFFFGMRHLPGWKV